MILDKKLVFADAVSVAAAAGTALIGDVIDLDTIGRRIASQDPLYLVIQVTTTFTSAGAAVVNFKLVSDAQAAIATDLTETEHWRSDGIGYATLVAGTRFSVPMPKGFPTYERYLGVEVLTTTATTTAGSISAFLTNDPQDWAALADAVN
jgi:hypothetical protein